MIDFNDIPRFEDAEARKARIRKACEGRIRELVRYLYPRAVMGARDARIGSVEGERGASLSIALTPDVPGQWIDHATGEKGDVLTLWQRALGLTDFADVLREAEKWVGGAPSQRAETRHRAEAAKPDGPQIIKREVATYPYLSASGEPLFEVVRFDEYFEDGSPHIKADGKQAKTFMPRQPSGQFGYPPGLRPLYRLPEIDRVREVVFVEGEKAADAIHRCGWVATSAPGGSNTRLDAIDWRPLAGKSVTLWPDNDDGGRKFMGEVAAQLASIGCTVRWVTIPGDVPPKWDAGDASEEEIHALLNRPQAADGSLQGQWIEEIEYAYEPELVEGLIPNAGVGVLFGPSSAGKSFIAVDWAIRMASERQVLARHTVLSGVLYFAAEGHGGLRKRIYAARSVHCVPGHLAPFNYLPAFLDLSRADTGDVARLTEYAASIAAEMKERGAPLRVIIVDTLAAAAPSADENVSRDMGPVMLSFHRMAAQLGCVVVLVAHTGKDVTRGLRGWSGIRANVDFAIECRVDKDEETGETTGRRLWFEKAKDGPDGFVLAEYHLKTTFLGNKPSGEPDTTCWVDYTDPPRAPSASEVKAAQERREREMADALKAEVLEALTECLTDQWRPLRETVDLLKHKGMLSMGVNALQGFLVSLAEVTDGVTEIWVNGWKIEIETTPRGDRPVRRFRALKG
jgi:hypothetical protein